VGKNAEEKSQRYYWRLIFLHPDCVGLNRCSIVTYRANLRTDRRDGSKQLSGVKDNSLVNGGGELERSNRGRKRNWTESDVVPIEAWAGTMGEVNS